MARATSFGICQLCGARVSKQAAVGHARKCLEKADGGPRSPVVLLRAQPAAARMYWLDIAARREARLSALDALLRNVWLECCGHLSEFYDRRRDTLRMNARIDGCLGVTGSRVGYVYDFGSSTELVVSHLGLLAAASVKAPRVVVRNEAPVWPCDQCGERATSIGGACACGGDGFLCEKHASEHVCGEEMLLPVVNSPRMGVCGYTGGGEV